MGGRHWRGMRQAGCRHRLVEVERRVVEGRACPCLEEDQERELARRRLARPRQLHQVAAGCVSQQAAARADCPIIIVHRKNGKLDKAIVDST